MMSMTEAEDAIVGASRVVKYDPSETARGDPMKYGAYRRWKLAEEEGGAAGAKGRPKSLRQASQRAQQTNKNKPPPAKGVKRGGKGTKKGKGTLNADSFYNAIKKFGSGPASKVRWLVRVAIIYFPFSLSIFFYNIIRYVDPIVFAPKRKYCITLLYYTLNLTIMYVRTD